MFHLSIVIPGVNEGDTKSLVQDVKNSTSSPHGIFWKSTGEENYRMPSHNKELAPGLTLNGTFLKCLLPS